MSHLMYPNLAKLQHFHRDLNYTGITLEGWNDPVNLIPFILLVVCLFSGLPSGFQAWWALINCAIIHPMDFFVGALGRGPKYLSDEYAVLDARYWPLDDPMVAWISYLELVVYIPLCYFWYRGIVQEKWYRHFCCLVVSTFQLMGAILYCGAEWHVGFIHLPASDWPPTFDSYLKIKYFWFVFLFCNSIWIIVPLGVMLWTFMDLETVLSRYDKQKTH